MKSLRETIVDTLANELHNPKSQTMITLVYKLTFRNTTKYNDKYT